MTKKKRLSDLYVVGRELTFGDDDDQVTVFMKKMNPIDQESAIRKANSARSRMLSILRDRDSDEYFAVLGQTEDIGNHEALVEFVIASKLMDFRQAREAELAAEEEWAKDNYLQGLRDAWEDELKEVHFTKPTDESTRVLAELTRFDEAVNALVVAEHDELFHTYSKRTDDELRKNAADAMISMAADTTWVREFRKAEIFYSVFEEDKKTRYFEDFEEIDGLSTEVIIRLMEAYRNLEMDPIEGKFSRGTASSSQPSDQPAPEATTNGSGPVDATL